MKTRQCRAKTFSVAGSKTVLFFTACFIFWLYCDGQAQPALPQPSDKTVRLWSLSDGREIGLSQQRLGNVNSLAYSPDGKILAIASGDGTIRLRDIRNGNLLATLEGHTQSVESVAFSPDGYLLVSGGWDGEIRIWDVKSGRTLKKLLGHTGGVLAVAFSPNGKYIASGSVDHTARVWSVERHLALMRFTGHQDEVTAVAFSPNGDTIATGSRDNTVKLWSTQTGLRLGKINLSHKDEVETIAFSPDGKFLASGSRDQTIKLWSLFNGREIMSLTGHTSSVNLIAFSPNGKTLASGSYDRTIKIWDVATGQELKTLTGHDQQITAIAFSPDGKTLASGSALSRSDNPTLHVLAIGINRVLQPEAGDIRDLRFSVKDAQDVTNSLEKLGRTRFERISTKVLVDIEANKENILRALIDMASEAKPQDTFVFFYSGHGTLTGKNQKTGQQEFSLIPYDAVAIKEERMISASLLSTFFIKIEAQHQLIILDTSYGNQGFDSLVARVTEENKSLEGLLQRDLVLLAAGMSYEDTQLKNGVLTSALLAGIKGEAADERGEISSRGLVVYLNEQMTQPPPKPAQFTKFKTFEIGNNFVLGLVTRARANDSRGSQGGGLARFSHPFSEQSKRLNQYALKYSVNYSLAKSILYEGVELRDAIIQPTPPQETRRSPDVIDDTPPQSALQRNGKDYALIIGISDYDNWNKLPNPVIDAEAIEKELKEVYGFETQLLRNPTKSEIVQALLKYRREITYSKDDQLFIFFAGHGYFNEDFQEGYLIAKNSLKVDVDVGGDTFFSHSSLRKVVDNIPCEHIFLVIDACYGGTIDEAIARRGEEPYAEATNPEFIRRKMQYKTRLFVTSGGKVYVPDGRPGQHSPFTRKFLDALRNAGGKDGILTINGLFSYIERVNPEPRKGEWGGNEPGSDFLFIAKKKL